MNKTIVFLTILLLFTACEVFEPREQRTYYNLTGEGYVYYYDTKEPASYVQVIASSTFRSNGYATVGPIKEEYPTDSAGFFCVRFLKRTHKEDVVLYHISPEKENYYSDASYHIFAEDLKKIKDTVQVDTLWLKKSSIIVKK